MQKDQLLELDNEEYVKTGIGNIVKDGYTGLQDRLELRMLIHYPMSCYVYPYDALQRQGPELHLDIDAVTQNYERQYNEKVGSFVVRDKLSELAKTQAIQVNDGAVHSNPDVYQQIAQEAPVT